MSPLQAAAWFVVALSLVYGDFGSGELWRGIVLPGLLLLALAYLFWLRGFIALAVAFVTFKYMDLGSTSVFDGVVLPLLFAITLMYLIWWSGARLHGGHRAGSGGDGELFGDGSGDGGGDGDAS